MRFLLDMNLPPATAEWLRSEGHDAIHVAAAGYATLPDREIFDRAVKDDRILVTFDLDFGEIVQLAAPAARGAVLLRLRSAREAYLHQRLRVALTQAADAMQSGAIVLVEDARIRIRRLPVED